MSFILTPKLRKLERRRDERLMLSHMITDLAFQITKMAQFSNLKRIGKCSKPIEIGTESKNGLGGILVGLHTHQVDSG